MKIEDIKLGGEPISRHIEQGYDINDFTCYLPLDENKMEERNIKTHFLGYYLNWVPQENYYYAVDSKSILKEQMELTRNMQVLMIRLMAFTTILCI